MNAIMIAQLPLVLGFMALLLVASMRPSPRPAVATALCVFSLVASALLLQFRVPVGESYFGGAYVITALGKSIGSLCLYLVAGAVLLTNGYLEKVRAQQADWKLVAMASALGMVSLSLAGDLATVFIAFEMVSIPSYVLAGFSQRDPRSNEAGIKYLLLGAVASAVFLLGLSFLYGATGEIHLQAIAAKLASADAGQLKLAQISLALVLSALFFKTAVAPFHFWLADVYQGSSLSALTVIASPVKLAVFGLLFALLNGPFASLSAMWKPALLLCAAASVVLGNVQAISQTQIKRLFAYSGVVNAAFILLTIVANSSTSFVLYLTTYGVMTTGLWAALMAVGTAQSDVDELSDLAGLSRKHPVIAVGLTVLLMSYAGVPPTAGFFAKFSAASDLLRQASSLPSWYIGVLGLAFVTTLISFYYYFQLLRQIWLNPPTENQPERHLLWNHRAVFAASALLLLALGFVL
jgi:proton-translocating NADH-quinone oxidoreductase chain N